MNSNERLQAALAGQTVDHVPFAPFLAYVWEYFPKEIQDQGQLAFHQHIGADPLWRGAPCPVRFLSPAEVQTSTFDESGRVVTKVQTPVGAIRQASARSEVGNTWFLVEHPLKTEEDYKVQIWIEEHTRLEPDARTVADHFCGAGREGLSLGMLIPRGKSAFQSLVEHHAGTEELNYALADFPDTVESLLDVMIRNDLAAARLAAASPYEYFITWEDSSTQNYSPAQYDKYIGPEIRQWCELLAAHQKRYVQHACGHVRDLLGRMKAGGVYAVESLAPRPTGNVALSEARGILGRETGIIGGIEPTEFLNLSETALAPYVEQVISDAAGGPHILANSDSCPPGVTVEKFKLVAQVAKSCKR
ncbi:MAG: uroporphyrinogen decarboxylase family protein [bacterium]